MNINYLTVSFMPNSKMQRLWSWIIWRLLLFPLSLSPFSLSPLCLSLLSPSFLFLIQEGFSGLSCAFKNIFLNIKHWTRIWRMTFFVLYLWSHFQILSSYAFLFFYFGRRMARNVSVIVSHLLCFSKTLAEVLSLPYPSKMF